jgi:hemin uptake protein HemP
MLEIKGVNQSETSSEYNSTVVESKELFKNGSSIKIIHGNEVYTLRVTKGNKLILTK